MHLNDQKDSNDLYILTNDTITQMLFCYCSTYLRIQNHVEIIF